MVRIMTTHSTDTVEAISHIIMKHIVTKHTEIVQVITVLTTRKTTIEKHIAVI